MVIRKTNPIQSQFKAKTKPILAQKWGSKPIQTQFERSQNHYFLDFLGACPSEDILISLKNEGDQALIEPVFEGEKPFEYRYVVMPMRA